MELEKNMVLLNILVREDTEAKKQRISAMFFVDGDKGLDKGTVLSMYCDDDYEGPRTFEDFQPLDRVRVVFDWKEVKGKENTTRNLTKLIDIKRL